MASQAALGVSALLLVLGIIIWFDRELHRGYRPPKHRVPAAVYRLMERARNHLFRGSSEVRFTVFMPSDREVLVPYARIGWGRPSAESSAEFAAGEGLVGRAVEFRGMLIARIGPFEDLEMARRTHKTAFHLTDRQAAALSETQLRVAVMIASPLWEGDLLKGVLAIDSLDPAVVPMDADTGFWNALNRLTADLAEALPHPKAFVEQAALPIGEGASVSHIRLRSSVRPPQEPIPQLEFNAPVQPRRVAAG